MIYTYKQMLNNECSYYVFMAQFVSDELVQYVVRHLGLKELENAYRKEEHLNSIPLCTWDTLTHGAPFNYALMRSTGESLSIASKVSCLKNAAYRAIGVRDINGNKIN